MENPEGIIANSYRILADHIVNCHKTNAELFSAVSKMCDIIHGINEQIGSVNSRIDLLNNRLQTIENKLDGEGWKYSSEWQTDE